MDSVSLMPLYDIGIVLAGAAILAYISARLKQPLIPAYIIAGVLIGPEFAKLLGISGYFGLVSDQQLIQLLSELGITFLLFVVGMEIDLSRLKDVGPVSIIGATLQVIFTFIFGLFAGMHFGYSILASVYFGLIVAFSSTMVVIKILQDRDELETLHGRIMLGILLMQDMLVVLALPVIGNAGDFTPEVIVVSLLKGAGIFALAIVSSKYVMPPFLGGVSKNREALFLSSILVAFIFCAISYLAGFSIAIGGFLAGISLAVFPYNLEIRESISSLRDFFATIFFVSLGMQLALPEISSLIWPAIVFSFIVLALKPAITIIIISILGYEKRTAFITGIGIAQVSEFSLILAALAYSTGVFSASMVSLTTVIAIITITLTSYSLKYHNLLYSASTPFLRPLDYIRRFGTRSLEHLPDEASKISGHTIVCGAHIMGQGVIDALQKFNQRFIVVDYNPNIVKSLISRGVHCTYGDICHGEVLEKMNFRDAKMIISTIPELEDSLMLIKKCKETNPEMSVFVTVNEIDQALLLYDRGADYVIIPKHISSEKIGACLSEIINSNKSASDIRKKEASNLLKKKEKDAELKGRLKKEHITIIKRKIIHG